MKMNLGMKIGAGFGALIVIACVLGGMAVYNMNRIGDLANTLNQEYVPEVTVASNIERSYLEAMLSIRSYALSEDKKYYEEGMKYLQEVKKYLDEAQTLADKSAHLGKLKANAVEAKNYLAEYTRLIGETVDLIAKVNEIEGAMDEGAKRFMENCNKLLDHQNESLKKDIAGAAVADKMTERHKKITIVNEVIDLGNAIQIASWKGQAQREMKRIQDAMKHFDTIEEKLKELIPITTLALNLEQIKEIRAAGKVYQAAMADYIKTTQSLAEVGGKRNTTTEKLLAAADSTANTGLEQTTQIAATSESALGTASTIMVAGLVGALILGVLIAIFITRSITAPVGKAVEMLGNMGRGRLDMRLHMDRSDEIGQMAKSMDDFADNLQNQVVAALQKLAQGDLTFDPKPFDDKDVIGNALMKTGEDLNRLVAQINAATEQIAAGSGQVSDSSQSLSQGATEQAASLEEITSSVTEMSSQTKANAENATQANSLSGETRRAAETGNEQMKTMVTAMNEINESGQNISKIIKVIDEIAFQTNLLALNAAVEAARAGRHGKGFAVVAEEVRNLAARSAKAAKETAELIEGSVQKAQNGTQIVNHTAQSLSEIVTAVAKVSDLVSEIAAASNEQAEGIAQINQGLGQIDQVTQQNTASAEEGAAAAEELSSQAAHLKGLMGQFKVKGQMMGYQQPAYTSKYELPPPPKAGPRKATTAGHRPQSGPLKPSEIIALDDTEFGKY